MAHRAGRKRKQGDRHPNGELTEVRGALDTAQWARLRRLAKQGVLNPHWGSAIGQLFVREELTPEQHEAGLRWGNLCRAYQRITGIPAWQPKTMWLGDKSHTSALDTAKMVCDAAYRETRDRATLNAYEAARSLMDGYELSAMARLCVMDEQPVMEGLLRCKAAMTRLVAYWEIGQSGARPGVIRGRAKNA